MSERKYCHLATVKVGEDLRVAHVDRDASSVHTGDMVSIDTGEMGTVVAVIFTEEGGEDYAFIADLCRIYEVTSIWRHAWTREVINEPA
jgi:hypothetical protein